MNLQPLFETQAILDNRIKDKHNLHGEDLLDKKILALQVELGELANEWQMFKFWKDDPKPQTDTCTYCEGDKRVYAVNRKLNVSTPVTKCPVCRGTGEREVNPLLEEYVDCLHFILSIGNEIGGMETYNYYAMDSPLNKNLVDTFTSLITDAESLKDPDRVQSYVFIFFKVFIIG